MNARILLASGEIIEIEDANSVLQMNRRRIIGEATVKIPYQVAVLCDPGNMNGKDFKYNDVLKIELHFEPSEYQYIIDKERKK